MIQVGICDDDQILARRLHSALKKIFAERGVKASFSLFRSGKELLESTTVFNIAFLDLDMPEMDGIEVGHRLHLKNPDLKIVIVSGMDHRMKEGYTIDAARFVTKPILMGELRDAVAAVTKESLGDLPIRLYFENMPYQEKQREIHYLITNNGHTRVYIGNKEYRRSEALSRILRELDPRLFVRISSHMVVNLQRISPETDYKTLFLGNEQFPISRLYREDFRRKYLEFDLHGRN